MSCHWDIGCKTCDVVSGVFRDNHADQALLLLIKQRAALAPLAKAADDVTASKSDGWRLADSVLNNSLVRIARFFAEHVGHDLHPQDEFGRWLDQCNDWAKCPVCKHVEQCARPRGHAPPHAPKATA